MLVYNPDQKNNAINLNMSKKDIVKIISQNYGKITEQNVYATQKGKTNK